MTHSYPPQYEYNSPVVLALVRDILTPLAAGQFTPDPVVAACLTAAATGGGWPAKAAIKQSASGLLDQIDGHPIWQLWGWGASGTRQPAFPALEAAPHPDAAFQARQHIMLALRTSGADVSPALQQAKDMLDPIRRAEGFWHKPAALGAALVAAWQQLEALDAQYPQADALLAVRRAAGLDLVLGVEQARGNPLAGLAQVLVAGLAGLPPTQ